MKYAIVDIETTGGSYVRSKITEIAMVVLEEGKIIQTYESLVNPNVVIPSNITALTGISQAMVANAPSIDEVLPMLLRKLEGCVFVAHNVNFDYHFIKYAAELEGLSFNFPRLCTVRLSRKLLPGKFSYSLGNLCQQLKIPNQQRHRAMGDAMATAQLFQLLQQVDTQKFIQTSLKRNGGEALLPPNLERQVFEKLPKAPGVYFFHDKKGRVIYVGKAKNIKQRISTHFGSNSDSRKKQWFSEEVCDISYELCGSELVAYLRELHEIKYKWPKYNRALKKQSFNFGAYLYFDQHGYKRLSINKVKRNFKPLLYFNGMLAARAQLQILQEDFQLCPKLMGLQKSPAACYDLASKKCQGACQQIEAVTAYNNRFDEAIQAFSSQYDNYVLYTPGRTADEKGLVVVNNGRYMGYGFAKTALLPAAPYANFSEIVEFIQRYPHLPEVEGILGSFIQKPTENIIIHRPEQPYQFDVENIVAFSSP